MSRELDYAALTLSKRYTFEAQAMNASVLPPTLATTAMRADTYSTADLAIRSIYNQFVGGYKVEGGLIVQGDPDSTTDPQPYINDLLTIHRWWDQRNTILHKIDDATKQWLKWSESIEEFFTTGIVSAIGSSGAITEIPFIDDSPSSGVSAVYQGRESEEGTIYSTKASNLAEYFHQILSHNAFGRITSRSGVALDTTKNRKARACLNELEDLLSAARYNIAGAQSAIDDVRVRLRQANEISSRALTTISSVRLGV